jgi:hypothetical protein
VHIVKYAAYAAVSVDATAAAAAATTAAAAAEQPWAGTLIEKIKSKGPLRCIVCFGTGQRFPGTPHKTNKTKFQIRKISKKKCVIQDFKRRSNKCRSEQDG